VPVKLHVHGRAGEYLAPLDRHRIPDACWFEDYSVDFAHRGVHLCTYIPGETRIDLPLGRVYIEGSKGFEIRPVRTTVKVTRKTRRIDVVIEKVLPWREKGWVSADTRVHFLSPPSALLEGAGEGGNVVNLLASQWGELMTNVGDFDGKTTIGSKEVGSEFFAAADAVTILEQLEGALAFLDTIGTRAENDACRRRRLVITSAHRRLHNRMHRLGYYHDHTPATDRAEHHRQRSPRRGRRRG